MIFAAPMALLAFAALPALYIILRLTPPPPRRQHFPPLALLRGLQDSDQTPNELPLWLLLLRLTAAALLILGFAGPTSDPPKILPGSGPILLVIDNGWASAHCWPELVNTAQELVRAAAEANRRVAILTTARSSANAPPQIQPVADATTALETLDAIQPEPWPTDRAGSNAALRSAGESTRFYLADGISDGPDFRSFLAALHPDRIYVSRTPPPLLVSVTPTGAGRFALRGMNVPPSNVLLAETEHGRILASAAFNAAGNATISLPDTLSSNVAKLTLAGVTTAAGTIYLDANSHPVIAGLAAGSADPSSPFLGTLYFLKRALPGTTQLITGAPVALLADKPGIIILADVPLNQIEQAQFHAFIAAGGVVLRFAGPLTAATPDTLSADPLIQSDRTLGGALTWTTPEPLAAFPADSPFEGLPVDPKATISRQILADPTTLDPQTVWASLADGTPIILGKPIGHGLLVNILTTANTGWSRLPLSGFFPNLLAQLVSIGRGEPLHPNTPLRLTLAMNAFGALSPATTPTSLSPAQYASASISPAQPPGIYGLGSGALALNLGAHIPPFKSISLANAATFGQVLPAINLGPNLLLLAALLLALDLAVSLRLRAGFRRAAISLALVIAIPAGARAQPAELQTELGYILTNDPATNQISNDGLAYLSANTSGHTSIQLGPPAALTPGQDDLNLYPLIYWPLIPGASSPNAAGCAALNDYMAHGGLLIIDMPGGDDAAPGSGAGFAPGAAATFQRATACLNLPPLQPLTNADVLAHSFYIVPDFPGRFTGAPVLVAVPAARDADGVTPVIVSQNDWAGAWARDLNGIPEQTPLPSAEDQRLIADRFGVNLVVYALTGSYKADQNTAPALLDRLQQ